MAKMVEAEVQSMAIDATLGSPVVLLGPKGAQDDDRVLPIWIGPGEAYAISLELEGKVRPRPLTHDLILNAIEGMGGSVVKVEITELRDTIFYALIHIKQPGGQVVEVDARPSDSIAVALGAKVPILVNEDLFSISGQLAGSAESESQTEEQSAEELRNRLRNINPEEFGSR